MVLKWQDLNFAVCVQVCRQVRSEHHIIKVIDNQLFHHLLNAC